MRFLIKYVCLLWIVGTCCCCSTIPKGVTPVAGFELNRYLGTWYEIARFDFKFEKDLMHTTATYTLNANGSVHVLNKGLNMKTKQWQSANGIAKFVKDTTVAQLKVSFFGPFYAGYNVIALDSAYQYALVCGNSTDYLWLLSRKTSIPENIKNEYMRLASNLGFDINRLLWVKHD